MLRREETAFAGRPDGVGPDGRNAIAASRHRLPVPECIRRDRRTALVDRL